jgi:hypothetical protein
MAVTGATGAAGWEAPSPRWGEGWGEGVLSAEGGRSRGFHGLLLLRRRSGGVGILAFGQDGGDRRIHGDVIGALGHQDLAENAFVGRFHFHGRLIGLDLGNHVAGLDDVAFLLQPFGEVALLHGWGQRGHQHLNGHHNSRSIVRPRAQR